MCIRDSSIAESIGYTEEVDALVEGLHQDLFVEYRERAYLETAPNIPDQDHVLGPELEESRLEESASIKATSESNIEPDQSAARWPKIAAVSILMAASWIVTADIDFQPGENYINDLVTLFSSTKSINETSSGTKVLDKKLAVEVQQPPIIPVLSNPIVMTMPELENLDKNISVELVQQLANTKPRVAFASQKDTLIHANVAPEFGVCETLELLRIIDHYQLKKIKDELKDVTKEAHDKEIFGAPTFIVNEKIFWGQDRLEYALDEYNR